MFGLAPRMAEVADLPWHEAQDLVAFQHRFMVNAFARPKDETVTLIAQDRGGTRLGFVHGESSTDSVTLEPCGYVTLLALTKEAEGQGVAARLMAGVEDWARDKGFRLLGLDVFANNQRARAFYRRLGYREDSLRLTKPLAPKT
ncbi:MAG TPA: GNAT family N-acetyltransferase [Dongiaceae bacterium]|nr:GNAT family N-acetyltransferase [Dongiaceae bacterium]